MLTGYIILNDIVKEQGVFSPFIPLFLSPLNFGVKKYMNKIKESYPDGKCPDCGDEIPDNVKDGDECLNCGHIFWEEREDDK
ncbi:MAG TPA: hypothetical protein PKX15_03435 [Bacteroidales bacterium]|nr:hypothetical protein [Bacteroidales bacterium]